MIVEPGSMIRDFRILGLIGSGGMGEVYLAEDVILQRKVAIKVLNPHLTGDEQFRQRFVNEARIQGNLQHANIVSLYSFFEQAGIYYMVLEYAPGRTLRDLIAAESPLPEARAYGILTQVLEALAYAHGQNVVHRDIKPSNLMIDEEDRVKVMDFGIARIMSDSHLTRTGHKVGTLYYMSPEQILTPREVDYRTDIYSTGIVFYEMLTGTLPYDTNTDSDFAVQKEIVDSHLTDPRRINPHISDNSTGLIRSLIQKDPALRPRIEDVLSGIKTARTHSYAKTVTAPVRHTSNESRDSGQEVRPPVTIKKSSKKGVIWAFIIPIVILISILVFTRKPDYEEPVPEPDYYEDYSEEEIEVEYGFEDEFDDDGNNWSIGINEEGFERRIVGGCLVLSNYDENQPWELQKKLDFDFDRNWKLSIRFGNRYNAFTDSPSYSANNYFHFAGDGSSESAQYRFARHAGSDYQSAYCTIENLATGSKMTLYDDTEIVEPDFVVYTIEKRGSRLYFYYDNDTPFYYQSDLNYFPFPESYGKWIGFGVYQDSQLLIDYIRLEYL